MNNHGEMSATQACTRPLEHLTALLDDELAPEDAAAARAHLAVCETCHEEVEALTAVRGLAGQWTLGPEHDFWPKIQSEIEASMSTAGPWNPRAEIQALREEVARLRKELASRPPLPASPRALFPYSPAPSAAARHIV